MRRTLTGVLAIMMTAGALVTLDAPPAYSWDRTIDITFPVDHDATNKGGSYHYTNDYDNGRSRGAHGATDIMVDYGTQVYATVGGVVSGTTGSGCWLGGPDNPPSWGYAVVLAGDDGRDYWYLHLGDDNKPSSSAYAPGITCGTRVERGQLLGYAGYSGNASSSAPHLHLEIHDDSVTDPYGDQRINPYFSLKAAEDRGDFPGAGNALPPNVSSEAAPIYGDWNGDGLVTQGWYDRGRVHLRNTIGPRISFSYGRDGDLPVVGDWNGNGVQTVGIVRDGRWHLRNSNTKGSADISFKYGRILDGDYPLAGDWNGNGVDTIGIVRDGEWHLRNSNTSGHGEIVYTYGRVRQGDVPVTGDWSGDGQDTPGIVRGREWHLRYEHSSGHADNAFTYGLADDLAVVGDWNSSGTTTPGIVRNGTWHLRNSNSSGGAHLTIDF